MSPPRWISHPGGPNPIVSAHLGHSISRALKVLSIAINIPVASINAIGTIIHTERNGKIERIKYKNKPWNIIALTR